MVPGVPLEPRKPSQFSSRPPSDHFFIQGRFIICSAIVEYFLQCSGITSASHVEENKTFRALDTMDATEQSFLDTRGRGE